MSRNELALMIGAALGMALWYGAPWIGGQPVPWDGGLRYLAALAIAGAVLEMVTRGAVWPGPAGLYAGQAVALLLPIITARVRLTLQPSGVEPSITGVPPQPWPIVFQLLFLASMTLAALLGSVAVAVALGWKPGWGDKGRRFPTETGGVERVDPGPTLTLDGVASQRDQTTVTLASRGQSVSDAAGPKSRPRR